MHVLGTYVCFDSNSRYFIILGLLNTFKYNCINGLSFGKHPGFPIGDFGTIRNYLSAKEKKKTSFPPANNKLPSKSINFSV